MSTPEGKVKVKIDAILAKYTNVIINPITKGYGKSGASDKITCIRGQFIAIEVKSNQAVGIKKYPTKLQYRFLASTLRNGGNVAIINEDNIDQLEGWISNIIDAAQFGGQPVPLMFDGCQHPYEAEQAKEVTI